MVYAAVSVVRLGKTSPSYRKRQQPLLYDSHPIAAVPDGASQLIAHNDQAAKVARGVPRGRRSGRWSLKMTQDWLPGTLPITGLSAALGAEAV